MNARNLIVFLVIGIGCATPADLTPKTGPGTDYPCGVQGLSCGGGMCCDQNETCGDGSAFSGCGKGLCCFVGEDSAFASKPAPHRQRMAH